jgi:hypothetical protein
LRKKALSTKKQIRTMRLQILEMLTHAFFGPAAAKALGRTVRKQLEGIPFVSADGDSAQSIFSQAEFIDLAVEIVEAAERKQDVITGRVGVHFHRFHRYPVPQHVEQLS